MPDDEAMPEAMSHGEPGGPAGMTIEEFCQARGLSRSRVDRRAREIGWRAVAEREGVSSVHRAKDIALKSIHLKPMEKKGLQVESSAGNERFSYEVVRPEAFFEHLAQEHGADLLTGRDIRRLLRYAKLLRDAASREGYYWLVGEGRIEEKTIARKKIIGETETLLQKAGWDSERKETPPPSS